MDRPAFIYVAYIATTPEKLWEALTDGQFTRRYWGGSRIECDWKTGSPVTHITEDGGIDWQGEVLQWERASIALLQVSHADLWRTALSGYL